MWFRGAAAFVGLYFNLGAVLEGHPDIILVVDRDVVNHRQPVVIPEFRQGFPIPKFLQVGFNLMPPGCALGNQVNNLCVSSLGFIESSY